MKIRLQRTDNQRLCFMSVAVVVIGVVLSLNSVSFVLAVNGNNPNDPESVVSPLNTTENNLTQDNLTNVTLSEGGEMAE